MLVVHPSVQIFSLDQDERRSREEFELLLHMALNLIIDDGILVAKSKNTSAIAVDVTKCHVSVVMR